MKFKEEINLEGEYREQLINIALNVLYTIFLPSPNLWRDIIINRNICMRFYILSNFKIKARIVYQNNTVRLPLRDILLTHLHVAKYCWQMK